MTLSRQIAVGIVLGYIGINVVNFLMLWGLRVVQLVFAAL